MNILWNQINLQRPPYRSWDVSKNEFDVNQFRKVIEKILSDFKSFQILHTEAALLSRLIYRMKSKFRSDKGLKNMEKVNRALLNYLNMAIDKEYKLLQEYIEINNESISLPSRQILEYILVRTQGFAKLMCRIESTAMIAANILKSRLYIGQSWSVAIIAYAVISRIWILSRFIIKKSTIWYNNIYNYIKIFKIVGKPWLPDDYVLPTNLSHWLQLPWINEDLIKVPLESDWGKSIFNLIQANDTQEESIKIIDELIVQSVKNECKQSQQLKQSIVKADDDFGKPISRLSFEELNQTSSKKTPTNIKEKIKHGKLNLKSNSLPVECEIVSVLKNESSNDLEVGNVKKKPKFENENLNKKMKIQIKSEKDLTYLLKADSFPKLDKLQWRIIQNRIKRLLLKLTKNNTCDLNSNLYKKINKRLNKWIDLQ